MENKPNNDIEYFVVYLPMNKIGKGFYEFLS